MIEKIKHVLNCNEEDETLVSVFEIDNALLLLGEISNRTEFLKNLKKYKNQVIDNKLSELSEKDTYIRSVILKTMKKHEPTEKTLSFPGSGKVTRKKPSKPSIKIEDQEKLIEYFKSNNIGKELIHTQEYLDANETKSYISELSDKDIPGVKIEQGKESISITFDKVPVVDNERLESESQKSSHSLLESLDAGDV